MVLSLPCLPHIEAEAHVANECAARFQAEAHAMNERARADEVETRSCELEEAPRPLRGQPGR